MKTALSMYLGGDEITNKEADHTTSKDFGLVCPACHEPVIYCAGGTRTNRIHNKTFKVEPYFSHYSRHLSNNECNLRIESDAVVRDRIQTEAFQGKNQRLKLYNRRLWEMVSFDLGKSSSHNKRKKAVLDAIGKDGLTDFAAFMISYLNDQECQASVNRKLEEILSPQGTASFIKNLKTILQEQTEPEDIDFYKSIIGYRSDTTKMALHNKICKEVFAFLATKTSKFFWKHYLVEIISYEANTRGISIQEAAWEKHKDIDVISAAIFHLTNISWVNIISHFIK